MALVNFQDIVPQLSEDEVYYGYLVVHNLAWKRARFTYNSGEAGWEMESLLPVRDGKLVVCACSFDDAQTLTWIRDPRRFEGDTTLTHQCNFSVEACISWGWQLLIDPDTLPITVLSEEMYF